MKYHMCYFIIGLFFFISGSFPASAFKNYRISILDAESKEFAGAVMTITNISITQKGDNRHLNLAVDIEQEINNEYDCLINVFDKQKTGEWKKSTMSSKRMKCCETFNKDKFLLPDIKKQLKVDKCPVPKGTYHLENYMVNTNPLPPMMPYGEWKIVLDLFKGSEVINRMSLVTEIERPKF